MVKDLQKHYDKLQGEITLQLAVIDNLIETWKFSRPDAAQTLETKKLTLERTLASVTQALASPETLTEDDIKTLEQKLENVESILKLLKRDTKPRWLKIIQSPFIILIALLILRSFAFSLETITSGANEPTLLIGDNVFVNHLAFFSKPIERGDLVMIESPDSPYEKRGTLKYFWQKFVGLRLPMFDMPGKPLNMVKRIIAIPGDTIEGRIENGKAVIYLNDTRLEEPYVNPFPLIAFKRKNVSLNPEVMTQRLLAPFFEETDVHNEYIWLTYNATANPHDSFYKLSSNQMVLHPVSKKPFFKNPDTPIAQDVFTRFTLKPKTYWCEGDNRRNSKDSRHWGAISQEIIKGKVEKILYSIDELESDWIFAALKDPIGFFKNHIRMDRFWKDLPTP